MLYVTYVCVCTRLTNKEDEACVLFFSLSLSSPMFPKREESIGNVKSTVAKMEKDSSSVVIRTETKERRKRKEILVKDRKEKKEKMMMMMMKKKIELT